MGEHKLHSKFKTQVVSHEAVRPTNQLSIFSKGSFTHASDAVSVPSSEFARGFAISNNKIQRLST